MNRKLVGKASIEYWQKNSTHAESDPIDSLGVRKDLIKEYFARTRAPQEPPPMFRSNFNLPYPAYFNSVDDSDLEAVLNFVDENFKEIGVSSVIVPEKKTIREKGKNPVVIRKSESCHLIGNVNPNILRTWEQLNQNNGRDSRQEEVERRHESDFPQNDNDLASFKVNYVSYARRPAKMASSVDDLYYDSIDDDEDEVDSTTSVSRSNAANSISTIRESTIYRSTKIDKQSSLMTEADLYIGDPPDGGEGIAEFDSLDKKRLAYSWSLDDD